MKYIKEIYYHIKGTPKAEDAGMGTVRDNYVKADCYYDKGGYSYFTYKQTPRAYFISAHKIGRGKSSCGYYESYQLFSDDGGKMLVREVARQTKKGEAEALAFFEENIGRLLERLYPDLELEVLDDALSFINNKLA